MINTQKPPFHNLLAYTQYVNKQVQQALAEDIGTGDLTAQLVPQNQMIEATILVREPAVICGIDWVNACFKHVDSNINVEWLIAEGDKVSPNQVLCKIKGLARNLLTAERCALNFLQTLSATATHTYLYVGAIAGTQAKIFDTRKTIPQFRLAQKYAVTIGGGHNQRLALFDGILIKENHITSAGSISLALKKADHLNSKRENKVSIQIEVENLAQLNEALLANANNILLDNFNLTQLEEAVALNKKMKKPALLEASGGITLENVGAVAMTGVDRISIGAITKHIQAIDLSMRFNQP